MGKNNSFSRREFLKAGTVASSALLLSNCTSVQGAFSAEKRNLDNEVVILGAGLAGLTAAYILKKNKVPFRIFEASPRIGGRVYTLQNFTTGGLSAELGADFFDDSHRRVFQLCKELSVETQELKPDQKMEERLYILKGQTYTQSDFKKKLKPLYAQLARHYGELFFNREIVLTVDNMNQYEKALYYDSLTADDFIRSLSTDVDLLAIEIYLLQIRDRFGVDPKMLSALQFLTSFGKDSLLNFQGTKSKYRVNGGNSALIKALYERVGGVIPDFIVKVDAAFTSIKTKTDGFELNFKINGKSRSYLAKQVICTLPFSCLRDVDGVKDMSFSAAKKELIQTQSYTNQAKTLADFSEKFWLKKTNQHLAFSGEISGDFASQNFYDAGVGQKAQGALLSSLRALKPNEMGTNALVKEAIDDLDRFHPGARALASANQSFMRWGDRPWSKGGRSVFAPMQFYKFSGVAVKPEYDGNFLFAGEHTSVEYAGSMEGAVSTGALAAEAFVKKAIQL